MNRKSHFFSRSLLLTISISFLTAAQAPSLDPAQTVNPATGEMAFSLPLGVVEGVNGHNYPVSLNYAAGIRLHQVAGPAGLGFSVDAGSITRKVVFVPDDSPGKAQYSLSLCDLKAWKAVVLGILQGLCVVVSFLATVYSGPLGVVLTIASIGLSTASSAISQYSFTPADHIAGGTHDPKYDYANNNGKGLFVGGSAADLPDVYFVNTPYVSGEFFWTGDHFVFKQTSGSIAAGGSTRLVTYDVATEKFTIQIEDGTKLIFSESDRSQPETFVIGNITPPGDQDCYYRLRMLLGGPVADQWHLTKVIFPDFTGSEDAVETTGNGSWIAFDYDVSSYPASSYGLTSNARIGYFQGSVRDVYDEDRYNDRFCTLKGIRTPNQQAVFTYNFDRLDETRSIFHGFGAWNSCAAGGLIGMAYRGAMSRFLMPRLKNINILSSSGTTVRKIDFSTNYALRPGSFRAFPTATALYPGEEMNLSNGAGMLACSTYFEDVDHYYTKDAGGNIVLSNATVDPNPSNACLTLQSVVISDGTNHQLPPISFTYGSNPSVPEVAHKLPEGSDVSKESCHLEPRDLWGYYLPLPQQPQPEGTANEFGSGGLKTRMLRVDGSAYADAWSLSRLSFPNGQSIEWTYEANRYDAVNGVTYDPVKGTAITSGNGEPKYGGGVRVKSVTATNGLGSTGSVALSFFYTDQPGVFVESVTGQVSNSSGHATVEPYDYTSESDYRTALATRGGLYTPAKVVYEMTQVVKSYQAPGIAPYGYTVYEFYTSKDHPNPGTYGERDESWRRGMPKCVTTKSNVGKEITKTTWEYTPIDQTDQYPRVFPHGEPSLYDWQNPIGWVRLNGIETYGEKVKTEKTFAYATKPEGRIECLTNTYLPAFRSTWQRSSSPRGGGDCVVVKEFGDPAKEDLVAMCGVHRTTDNVRYYASIQIAPDIAFTDETVPTWKVYEQQLGYMPYAYNGCYRLTGTCIANLDADVRPEIIYVRDRYRNDLTPTDFVCHVLKNVSYASGQMSVQGILPGFIEPDFVIDANPYITTDEVRTAHRYPYTACAGPLGASNQIVFVSYWCRNPAVAATDGRCQIVVGRMDITGSTPQFLDKCRSVRIDNLPSFVLPIYGCYNGAFESSGNITAKLITNTAGGKDLVVAGIATVSGTAECKIKRVVFRNIQATGGSVTWSSMESLPDPTFSFIPYSDMGSFTMGMCFPENATESLPIYTLGWNMSAVMSLFRGVKRFSDYDGQPDQIIQTNSSTGRAIGTAIMPAYWATPYASAMKAKNMLTPACQSVSYDLATPTSTFDNARVVSAGSTAWSLVGGNWLPQRTYSWRKNMTSAGLPTGSFTDYVFSTADDATNPDWVRTSEVERYTAYSQPIQTKNAAGTRSAIIYDKNSVYQNAAIANAALSECIFTSWEDRATGGLVMGTGTAALIDATTSHAGDNSLKLAQGTAGDPYVLTEDTPTPGMTAAKKVRWEFWAKADSVNAKSFTHLQAPDMTWYGDNAFTVGTTWQKFAFEVTVPAGKQYHVVLRAPVSSGHAAKTGTIWYDDVRAYPSDAMMTSYTYDPALGVPTSVTDANNNTSKSTYDGFGRVTAQYNTKGQKVKQFSYHLQNEPEPVYYQNFETGTTNFVVNFGSPIIAFQTGTDYGRSSSIDFVVSGTANNAQLNLPSGIFAGKKVTVTGSYKSDNGNTVGIGFWYTVGGTSSYEGVWPACSGTWQSFTLSHDFTGATPTNLYVLFYLSGKPSGNGTTVLIDEIKVVQN